MDTDNNGLVKIRVVRIDDGAIVLKVGAIVEVEVEASFDFSMTDPTDKDYVNMGGNVCTTTETYHTDILLTLSGNFSQDFGDIEIDEIEVLENISSANFGEIEPDWRSDYED